MSILVIGVNHRTSPLALLERLTLAPENLGKAVSGLSQRDNIREAVVLSTCNRTEVYVVTELFHGAYGDVRDFLCEISNLSVDELTPHLYSQHDSAAVSHLFEVAAGLDSAVLGESEILGQVKTAWETAQFEGAARSSLNLLFRSAVETGKRARSETTISRGTASISHAAVEMATEVVGELAGKRVAVIGAGSMGEGVAVALHKAGGSEILVVNRSPERGASLAARVSGRTVGMDHLTDAVATADVIVASTGSDEPIITTELVRNARLGGADQPLHIFDIAMPRDVEVGVADLAGVTVFNLDDLRDWADRGLAHRATEADRVRAIVLEEVDLFAVESIARQAAPLVASMREAADRVRAGELARYSSKLDALGEKERQTVEAITKAIVAKLLHEPSVRLKAQAGTPQGDRNAAAVRDLFDLT
ncbi:MAG: glutamyl-tRNA reductase [Candidatus Azotimanducaceae bacterium]|jgi:glutamyl-tRNA reductase